VGHWVAQHRRGLAQAFQIATLVALTAVNVLQLGMDPLTDAAEGAEVLGAVGDAAAEAGETAAGASDAAAGAGEAAAGAGEATAGAGGAAAGAGGAAAGAGETATAAGDAASGAGDAAAEGTSVASKINTALSSLGGRAALGAGLGASGSTINQLAYNHKINGVEVLIGAASGAAGGIVPTNTFVGATLSGGITGTLNDLGTQLYTNRGHVNFIELGGEAANGALTGGAGFRGGEGMISSELGKTLYGGGFGLFNGSLDPWPTLVGSL
jgi:hypothetical protein